MNINVKNGLTNFVGGVVTLVAAKLVSDLTNGGINKLKEKVVNLKEQKKES